MENNMNMNLYDNTGYNKTNKKQKLTIEIPNDSHTGVTIHLLEPLRIDTQTEVYLDSFTSGTGVQVCASFRRNIFVLTIDELEIKSNVGTLASDDYTLAERNTFYNNIIIPNTRWHDDGVGYLTSTHRPEKFNYISTINPRIIRSLNVKLGIVDDVTGIYRSGTGEGLNGKVWLSLMFISKE